jgi:hypothetical protein
MEQIKKQNTPALDPQRPAAAPEGPQWKGPLKHSVRGMSYAEGSSQLSPRSGMPMPPPPGLTPTTENKPFDIADPELRKSHQDNPSYTYKRFGGSLFLNGVSANDVVQGAIGDCYLAAALSAVANTHPAAITSMVKDDGNGKYRVRFYKKSYYGAPKEEWITVDGDLPTSGSGPLYAKGAETDAKGQRELWPSIIEKAWAAWKGGYDDIGEGGFSGDVMTAITGEASSYKTLASMKPDALWDDMKKAIDAGQPVTCGTHGKDDVEKNESLKKKYDEAKVYPWHAYTVISYREKKEGANTERFVTIRNPWGQANRDTTAADKGLFELKFDLFKTVYQSIVINEKKAR